MGMQMGALIGGFGVGEVSVYRPFLSGRISVFFFILSGRLDLTALIRGLGDKMSSRFYLKLSLARAIGFAGSPEV